MLNSRAGNRAAAGRRTPPGPGGSNGNPILCATRPSRHPGLWIEDWGSRILVIPTFPLPTPDPRPAVSYVSLYRKYRSQTFSDLIGQDHVVRTLQNGIR